MAMVLTPFVERLVNKAMELIEGEVALLWDLKGEFNKLILTLNAMSSTLDEAESKSIKDKLLKRWLDQLKDVMYDAEDIVERCKIEIERNKKHTLLLDHRKGLHTPLSSFRFLGVDRIIFGHKISKRIGSINSRLAMINKQRSDFGLGPAGGQPSAGPAARTWDTSQYPDLDTVGLEDDIVDVMKMLDDKELIGTPFPVVAIQGTGGIGKTTLAQRVYNEQSVKDGYSLRIWLCVNKGTSDKDVLEMMIGFSGGKHGKAKSKAELEGILAPLISGRKIFLVLDDLWEAELWNKLKRVLAHSKAAPSSRVLITSRLDEVRRGLNAQRYHSMKELSLRNGWELLCKKLHGDAKEKEKLKDIGMKFVERCHGLPLAINAIAGVLNTKDMVEAEWMKVLEREAWFTGGKLDEAVRGPLYLSYQDLPSHLKHCFLYMSLFPESFSYRRKDIARLWVAEGYVIPNRDALLEELAEDYYNELISRNILQPDPRYLDDSSCSMHGLLQELAISLAKDESYFGEAGSASSSAASTKLRRLSLTTITSSSGQETSVLGSPVTAETPKTLRTLMLYTGHQTMAVGNDLFKKLKLLRVLDLSCTGIQNLPQSIHHLIHLKLLDLGGTQIAQLPESIGELGSLLTLNLSRCKSLLSLPRGITRLHSLRCLLLTETPVSHLPPGIGQLQQLNHLEGFVVGEQWQQKICSMDELQSLSQLRFLLLTKLERATSGTRALAEKPHLKELLLHCTPQTSTTDNEIDRIQQIFDELCPPNCLDALTIRDFFGCQYPTWMQSSSMSSSLSHLTKVYLHGCSSWKELPPLGQLKKLRFLTIVGASSVVEIGHEFLGFPALEVLKLYEMTSWEEWSSPDGITEWMPHLKLLGLKQCPNLQALPKGLNLAVALEVLHIEGADKLRVIENLHCSPKSLHLLRNHNLEEISNLPAVVNLMISDCPMLYGENLNGVQCLHLIDSSLLDLNLMQQLSKFRLECQDHLFLKCIEGAGYWEYLQVVQIVSILTNYGCRAYLYYTKEPYTYKCNLSFSSSES